MQEVCQGDILKIENIKLPVLVVSKDFFNRSGEIIGCPIYLDGESGGVRARISGKKVSGCVHCEKIALLDLNVRGYSKVDEVSIADRIVVSDIIQGLIDYI